MLSSPRQDVGGGYHYWDSDYWYPAGAMTRLSLYVYDGPIYIMITAARPGGCDRQSMAKLARKRAMLLAPSKPITISR